MFLSGIELVKDKKGNITSRGAGYRADVANAAPVLLSEKRVMVYAHWNSNLTKAKAALNGLLNGLGKSATVKSVIMYSKGGRHSGDAYSSGLRFYGLCDPSPEGSYLSSGAYGSNTYLDKNEGNWSSSADFPYSTRIKNLEKKVKDKGGSVVNTSQSHGGYPGYFMNKYKDKI